LIITTQSAGLDAFLSALAERIAAIAPAKMLHQGISKAYNSNRSQALAQSDVRVVSVSAVEAIEDEGQPTMATVGGDAFLANPILHQEVFGPYSLVVVCKDEKQMMQIASSIEGQLTCSIMATDNELSHELFKLIDLKCGRMILNGVPTGVEVCWSMQHGGPFPATTDSRFGSVGPDAIKRFVRPISFQNYPDGLLPDELKESNPLNVIRMMNGLLEQST
jgi:NADP-dependent aldehyde dehydrogenase